MLATTHERVFTVPESELRLPDKLAIFPVAVERLVFVVTRFPLSVAIFPVAVARFVLILVIFPFIPAIDPVSPATVPDNAFCARILVK